MRCVYCDSGDTSVVDTRDTEDKVRRRRECDDCGRRFTTYEEAEQFDITVIKKSGDREDFSEEKLRDGIERATNKTSLGEDDAGKIVEEVKNEIRGEKEVSAREIGEQVKESLKKRDEVAYIRFASVYESFDDAESFEEEVKALKQE
ncbi:MAG: transcriptional regulator NrdR [Candidatus Nanohaloarchaea archaeon]